MSNRTLDILIVVTAAVILSIVAFGFYVKYEQTNATNFEECLLIKMKGQNENLTQTAARLCERKFPKSDA